MYESDGNHVDSFANFKTFSDFCAPKNHDMKKGNKKKQKGFLYKLLLAMAFVLVLIVGYKVYDLYKNVEEPNVKLDNNKPTYIYIPSGSSYHDVANILFENGYIINRSSFEWVAEKKNYQNKVKPGKYKLTNGMSNNQLVNLLRSGKQVPVKLVFNKIRTKERFAGIISKQIEADSTEILKRLYDVQYLKRFDKNLETAMTLFIPNTYEFYWNTNADVFFKRMEQESKRFWNDKRIKKARDLNMTPNQVITLASIIEEETTKNDEKATMAGVYLNRIRKGIRLQADPTLRFALGDFTIKRILNAHKNLDSPYNTYKNAGLPPGPICLPSISSIDAVLNYQKHNYLYFCAKDDFSGYHVFAKTLKQHNQNAVKYHQALNKKRIYR